MNKKIRESIVSGSFYSSDPKALKEQINQYLDHVPDYGIDNIVSIICPHAGYVYSGQVAAYSYKQIDPKAYSLVIVIAPSHSEYFDFVSIYDGDAYRTPLGIVEVNKEKSKMLAKSSDSIFLSTAGHGQEHSLEVQIPFLQIVLGDFDMIPIVIGDQSKNNIKELAEAISGVFKNENILIVASTDLSHYHPYGLAVDLDSAVEKYINAFDADGLMDDFAERNLEMCGGGPVASAMLASKKMGADTTRVLKYQNSGDVSGDKSAVVGYLSAVIFKE